MIVAIGMINSGTIVPMATIHRKKPVPVLVLHSLLRMGDRVKIARKARQMTQAELAQLAGVGISTVASIEGGFDGIAFGHVLRVLDAMGLLDQADELFSPKSDPEIVNYALNSLSKP